MNEQPSPQPRAKRWKWILGIAAILVFSTALAVLVILSSIDFNRLKPLLTQAVKQETGRDLEIRGAIDLKLGLNPSVVIDEILFQNAPWASSPEMVKIKRLDAKIMLMPLLKGDILITRLVLSEPEVLIETDESGKWNFEFEKRAASPRKNSSPRIFTLPKMVFHHVSVEKGKVSYRDGATGTLYGLKIDRFTAHSEGSESPVVLAFNGSYKEKPFELCGTVGSVLLVKEQGKGYPVDLALKALGAQLRVEGLILDMLNLNGLALKVSAELKSTSQIAAFLGETQPIEFGPLQTTVAISDSGDKIYKLSDLRISSRAGDAGGSLTVHLGGQRPKLSGALVSRRLDLNPFFSGRKRRQAKTENGAEKNRIFPNDPLPLDILKSADIQLKFDAGQVQWPHFPLTNLSMEVTLDDGRLVLRPIKVKAAGGDAEGCMELHPQGSVATAKAVFKVNQADLRLLSADLGVEGRVDIDLNFLSRGSSIAGLMAGLNGGTVVVMGQGRVDNKSIQYLAGDLATGLFQLLNPSSKTANYTDINCEVSGFEIQDGLAKVTALVVDTLDMTVIGEGQVNLRDETLDLSLKHYPKGGAAGLNLSLGELAKSFKLGGTLANPSLQMDAEQTALVAALKAAGGVLLFGPAGIAAVFAGQSSGEDNPCLSALENARKGLRSTESGNGVEQNKAEEKGIPGALMRVGESVKKFFTGQGTQSLADTLPDPYKGGGP